MRRAQRVRGAARITSYDVAAAAGVSQSSVSRAFDPDGAVTAAMRKRIKSAAAALGWRPNSIASSLQKRRTDFIGLITAELSSPWRAQQLSALLPALEKAGHRPLIFHTERDSDIDDLIDEVLSYQCRAVVISAGLMSARIAKVCAKSGLLVVLLNRKAVEKNVISVGCDYRQGARMAVDYVAQRGCRRIALLQGSVDSYPSQQRTLGFLERAAAHRLEAEIIPMGAFEREAGRRAGVLLANRPLEKRPEGILAGNDAMALGVLDHAYATGDFEVPRDFALIGFDDLREAEAPAYQLTTIRQPLGDLTIELVSLLNDWRDGGGRKFAAREQLLQPNLIERRSGLWTRTI